MGERMVRLLSFVCGEVMLVGSGTGSEEPSGVLRIDDLRPGQGPLAGIESLLASGRGRSYLVVPVDQPLLLPSLLHALVAAAAGGAALYRLPGRVDPEPLPVVLPSSALPLVARALDAGRSALRPLWTSLGPRVLEVPPSRKACFRNVNAPADLGDDEFLDHLVPLR